jgi:hypothetical protein
MLKMKTRIAMREIERLDRRHSLQRLGIRTIADGGVGLKSVLGTW